MQLDDESKTKFYFFKNFFKKTPSLSVTPPPQEIISVSKEKEKIEEDIAFIIDTNNASQFKVLMDNDILLSGSNMWKVLFESPDLINPKVIDMALTHYMDEMNTWTINAFARFNAHVKGGCDFYHADKTSQKYKDKTNFDNICSFIHDTNGVQLRGKDVINKLYTLNKEIISNIDNLTHKTYVSKSEGHAKYVSRILNLKYNEVNSDDMMNLVKRAKLLNDKNIQTTIAQNIIKNTQKYDTSFLPADSRKLLQEINQYFIDLEEKNLQADKQFMINNLFEKRLPQVLTEYLSIPEKYRKQLNEQQDNPDSLLYDSLSEIRKNLRELNGEILQTKVDQMKKTNRYLHNMN